MITGKIQSDGAGCIYRSLDPLLQSSLSGWLAAGQLGQALPVLLLDLDHFKRINDRLGHDIGDLVLKQLADLLRKVVAGESEPMIRLGGEEFLLLLQVDDEQELALRVEYLRQRVAQHRFGKEDAPLWLTVSLGFVAIHCTRSARIHSGVTASNWLIWRFIRPSRRGEINGAAI